MSKIEASSLSSSPSVPSLRLQPTAHGCAPSPIPYVSANANANVARAGTESEAATPAPEPLSAVASTSALDAEPIVVDDEPNGDGGRRDGRARSETKRTLREVDFEELGRRVKRRVAAKGRSYEEEEIMAQTATRMALRLNADHAAAINPDVDAPFVDAADAVRRLLPYHVFQHPRQDLERLAARPIFSSQKGKGKATEADVLREQVAETRFALECWRRWSALEKRFRRTRIQSGERASPDDQGYILAQAVLEAERLETANINVELRSARAEVDKVERERRAAAPPPPAARPLVTSYSATPAAQAAYMSQYRGYAYPYAQGYGTSQYTFSPAFQATHPGTTPTPNPYGATSAYNAVATPGTRYASPSTYTTPAASTTVPITPVEVTQAQSRPATAPVSAIPVQLPRTSLPALQAIGLEPVAPAPAGQPQPASVLKSETETTLHMEINVGSLQPFQMSGLAVILNALTSRGVTVDGNVGATSGATARGGDVQGLQAAAATVTTPSQSAS